jgi:hypothetical protein
MVIDALNQAEWVPIGALYPATSRRVKRDLLHSVLQNMLEQNEIVMRTTPVYRARARTEFKTAY